MTLGWYRLLSETEWDAVLAYAVLAVSSKMLIKKETYFVYTHRDEEHLRHIADTVVKVGGGKLHWHFDSEKDDKGKWFFRAIFTGDVNEAWRVLTALHDAYFTPVYS